jgi:chromosome segregation ATPase
LGGGSGPALILWE